MTKSELSAAASNAMKDMATVFDKTTKSIREFADAIPLSSEEQMLADVLENTIEDNLETLYDPANPKVAIRVPMNKEVPFNVLRYLLSRFTAWNIECDSNALEFTPQ